MDLMRVIKNVQTYKLYTGLNGGDSEENILIYNIMTPITQCFTLRL